IELIRDRNKATCLGDHYFGITAIGMGAGVSLILTIYQVAGPTIATVPAAAGEKADSDAPTDRPAFHVRTNSIDSAHHLVAGNARPLNREQSIYGRCIGMTDAACLNPDTNVSKRRIEYWLRGQLPLARADNLYRTVGV